MANNGWIQIQRASEELFYSDLDAYLVMTQIMYRALRKQSKYNKHNLQLNQAEIGDYESIGLTERRYRDAKIRIEHQYKLATFKGTNKGTIATLVGIDFCDINCEVSEQAPCKNSTEKGQTKDEQKDEQKTDRTIDRPVSYDQKEEKKDEQKDEQKTDKGRTKDEQRTTKEEYNNITMQERTTTPLPPEGDSVVVDFYECLKLNTDLTDEEKEILQRYPENRVKLALEFAKTEKPTTTLMQMLIWHCREKFPPKPKSKKLTDQQRMAVEFNAYLLSIGLELMYQENLKNIEEGVYILTPLGGGATPISLSTPPLQLRKDFEEVKKEQRKLKYG